MNKDVLHDRITIIDILRGFTLLGIAIVHFADQYYAGPHPKKFQDFNILFLGDEIMIWLTSIFISGKFFMIFSFLFGLSFSLQLTKSEGTSSFLLLFLWRLIILLAIGFLHHLHYRGDILTIYAMLGVGLLIFYKLPEKLLLIIALCLALNIPSVVVRGVSAILATPEQTEAAFSFNDSEAEVYYNTLSAGGYFEIWKANLKELNFKYQFQIESGRIYITMGLFLLGLYAGRKKIFEKLPETLPLFKALLRRCLWAIPILIVIGLIVFGGAQLANIQLPDLIQWTVGGFLSDVFNLAMAAIYVITVVLLFQKEKWQPRLMMFYEVGRMGLTTYLMQTAFGMLLFFGVGFGLMAKIGSLASVGIGILFFGAQIYFSRWWLSKYKYGPVEWLWRSCTYLKIQPFKKPTP
jgi:uncharacterized protein